MPDEVRSRRSEFREGTKVRLADNQEWTLPASRSGSENETSSSSGSQDSDLLKAIIEAENQSERKLAALAFAIFLLAENYSLPPEDFEQILEFIPESPESYAWQATVESVVQEHLRLFFKSQNVRSESEFIQLSRGRLTRLLTWIWNRLPFRSLPSSFRSHQFDL